MHPIAQLDRRYVWHPFTQMADWAKREPIIIAAGKGAVLQDVHGRSYLDANASIWTNLHGHGHPRINRAIQRQLGKIAHSSALGFANIPASQLAARLVRAAQPLTGRGAVVAGKGQGPTLSKVFFSDDGSTAMEVALKLAYEYARRVTRLRRPRFLSLQGAYHGDTVGAVSLGHIDLFHRAYQRLLFPVDSVMAPYCYRCPFNRARPERADAREYRRCHWECVDQVARKFEVAKRKQQPYAGLVVEPLMQGAAGMIPQPRGWLARVAELARHYGTPILADEVMTGFGRTGFQEPNPGTSSPRGGLFACQLEGVTPDYLAVAKGLTGGYLPMAATMTTMPVYEAFLGGYEEFKTFFHGHSFTGNQLGAAAALESLSLLEAPAARRSRWSLQQHLEEELRGLWRLPHVGDIRQVGLVVGVELVRDAATRRAFDLRERIGIRVCEAMAERGVLTRPIGNVIVLLPPYCMTRAQVRRMVGALGSAIEEVVASVG
jgi:adenosylmethionine-8-amino-7-oxononanoate aminotransferase